MPFPRRPPRIKPPPWRDRTWPSTVLPHVPTPDAAVAERGTVPDTLRSYKVGVVRVRGHLVAYTRDVEGGGFCEHHVSATGTEEAKQIARTEHRESCPR